MKALFKLANLILIVGLLATGIASATGLNPLAVGGGIVAIAALSGAYLPQGVLLYSIDVSDVTAELGAYFRTYHEQVRGIFYQQTQATRYMRTISQVKGKYPAPHALLSRLMQPFAKAWNAVGDVKIKANELSNYHVKFDLEYYPADILGTWTAFLYDEGLAAKDMPISRYIIEQHLSPAIGRDMDYLMGNGDTAVVDGFTNTLNGIKKLLAAGIADYSMYKIPMASLAAGNVLDSVERFEDLIPDNIRPFITKLYMSSRNADLYKRDVRNSYGTAQDFGKGELMRTYVGNREIIGLNCLNGWNGIFATPDENFLRLINLESAPTIQVEQEDRKVKVFADWFDGPAFWFNQYVLVTHTPGSGSGLAVDNNLYYS